MQLSLGSIKVSALHTLCINDCPRNIVFYTFRFLKALVERVKEHLCYIFILKKPHLWLIGANSSELVVQPGGAGMGRRKGSHNCLARSARDIMWEMISCMSGLCHFSLRVSLCHGLVYFQLNGLTYGHIIAQLQVFRLILETEMLFN